MSEITKWNKIATIILFSVVLAGCSAKKLPFVNTAPQTLGDEQPNVQSPIIKERVVKKERLNSLTPLMVNAVERVFRVSNLSEKQLSMLKDVLQQMPAFEFKSINISCKLAFDNLTPSKCDKLLLKLINN